MKVIITKGIPASGKSTWSKQKVKESKGKWKRITKDYLRYMLDETQFSKEREQFIQKARDSLLETILREGYNAIVDDTNFHPKHEKRIREIAQKYGAEVEVKWFPIHLDDALRRNERREARVPPKVIHKMYKDYQEAGGPAVIIRDVDEQPSFREGLDAAIVCDLDGTLAIFNHHRGPYDASTCDKDRPNYAVLEVLTKFADTHVIILLSGREDKYRTQTKKFLKNNDVPYDMLLMRKTGDARKDYIVKKELFDNYIREYFNVLFMMDDRDQVVDMWRRMEIPCFQVNYGAF